MSGFVRIDGVTFRRSTRDFIYVAVILRAVLFFVHVKSEVSLNFCVSGSVRGDGVTFYSYTGDLIDVAVFLCALLFFVPDKSEVSLNFCVSGRVQSVAMVLRFAVIPEIFYLWLYFVQCCFRLSNVRFQ